MPFQSNQRHREKYVAPLVNNVVKWVQSAFPEHLFCFRYTIARSRFLGWLATGDHTSNLFWEVSYLSHAL